MDHESPPADLPASLAFVAYAVSPRNMQLVRQLVRAPAHRDWMDRTDQRFANRCLPLLIANQAGWLVVTEHRIRATWRGGATTGSVDVDVLDGAEPPPAASHFGHGIVTWTLPFLFRTPPGWNLLVRGPANEVRDGIVALEGVVETDWAVAPFTMNWKFTRPGVTVVWEPGDAVCMVVPQPRALLEQFDPAVRDLRDEPELAAAYAEWSESRRLFLEGLRRPGSAEAALKWQRHYFLGTSPTGVSAADHQTKLRLNDFDATVDN